MPAPGRRATYAYDLDGHPTTVGRPDGSTVTMGYDPSGRIARHPPGGAMTLGCNARPESSRARQGHGVNLAYGYDGSLLTSATWAAHHERRRADAIALRGTETINSQARRRRRSGTITTGL
jgi:YD repeat-containing protein